MDLTPNQRDWILEAEKNDALTPKQQQWLTEARAHGVMPEATPGDGGFSLPETVEDITRSLTQGATFGWGDEVRAAGGLLADRLMGGDASFGEIQAQEQARTEEIPSGIAIPGQIIGGLATGSALTSPQVVGALTQLPTWARVLSLPAGGAVAGAVEGAGQAGPGERLGGAGTGAAVGAALGTAIPGVFKGGQFIANKIARGTPLSQAERQIVRSLRRDGLTPEQAFDRVRQMGPNASLVDVGRNTAGLAEAGATRPGAALTAAQDFVENRKVNQFSRVIDELDSAAPPARSVVATEGTPQFAQVLEQEIPVTPTMQRLWQRPAVQDAWRRAQVLAGEQDQALPSIDEIQGLVNSVRADPQGRVTMPVRLMHWLKKGLDDAIEPRRNPVTGQLEAQYGANQLRAMQDTRAALRGHVRELSPDYGKALDAISAQKRIEEAGELGGQFLAGRFKNDRLVTQAMQRMSQEEREAFQRGALRAMEDSIAGRGDQNFDVTGSVLRQSRKLRALLGERAEPVLNAMRQEREFARTGNTILGNSRTAYRNQALEDMADGGADAVIDAATGTPSNLLVRAARAGANALTRPSERVADEIAPMLFETSIQRQQRILQNLLRQSQQQAAANNRLQGLAALSTLGAIQGR